MPVSICQLAYSQHKKEENEMSSKDSKTATVKKTQSKTSKTQLQKSAKAEVKERAIRKSANPRLQKVAESKSSEIERALFAYAAKQNGVAVRGSRLVIARNVAFPIGFVVHALGMEKATFPSTEGNPLPTLAQEGSDKNVCMGDMIRALIRAGTRTVNLHKEKLPKGVVLASEKFPRKA